MASLSAIRSNPRLRARAFRQFILDELRSNPAIRPGQTTRRFVEEYGCQPSAVSVQNIFDRLVRQGILSRVAYGTYSHAMRPPTKAAVAAAGNDSVRRIAEILGGRCRPTQRVIQEMGLSLAVGYTIIRKMKAQGLVRQPRRGDLELTLAGEELLPKRAPVEEYIDPFS